MGLSKENPSNRFFQEIVVLFFFICLTAYYFLPLLKHFDRSLPDDYDGLLTTWSITRMAKNFPQRPSRLFEGNIFYPHPFSHAYSDPLITAGLLAKPLLKIIPEPILAFNLNLVLGQLLTLYFTYLFLKELTQDRLVAFVLSVAFSFSLIHLHYLGHLHTFLIQLVPLSGFCLLKLAKTKRPLWLYLGFACFLLQTLNSFLPGYFILFLASSLYLSQPRLKEAVKQNLIHLIVGGLISFAGLFPVIRIYLSVSRHFHYVRPITEVIHFSLSPEEVVTKFFSPGLYLIALVSLAFFFINKKSRLRKKSGFLLLAIASFIISLGPVLHWQRKTIKIPFHLPLPYLLFYFLAPGFKGFRTPSRWLLLTALALTAFSALELARLFKNKKAKIRKGLSLAFVLLFTLLTTWRPNDYVLVPKVKDFPPVYSWLRSQKGEVVIELPINTWGSTQANKQEAYRMLYSLLHQKKLVNGYSGYLPEEYFQLVAFLKNNFPSQEAVGRLKAMKIDYLILHQEEYDKIWLEKKGEKLKQLNQLKGLKLIKSFDADLVYQL